ncbi:hypothetical protein F1847_00910 [Thermodesulfobacterium sp. TA1]|nr:anaerobic ribonucleoside-triphosphate reductase [Thermodesulfobacterium sp. TA1]QER41367.1 hypothetical protein F1847_00910 [Thermodesulfobacterium sp. TA1]
MKEKQKVKVVSCEVYSRVVGYFRPVQNWNKGKQQEFNERKTARLDGSFSPNSSYTERH